MARLVSRTARECVSVVLSRQFMAICYSSDEVTGHQRENSVTFVVRPCALTDRAEGDPVIHCHAASLPGRTLQHLSVHDV